MNSWKAFTEFIESYTPDYPDIITPYLQFRGQSNSTWKLETSLTRIIRGDKTSEEKAKYYEFQAQSEFRSQVHLLDDKIHYTDDADLVGILIDMQHYSCPTRLLDWTNSPFIALYFAVNENFEHDGSFNMWDSRPYTKKMKTIHKDYNKAVHKVIEFTEYEFISIILTTKKNQRLARQQGTFTVSNNLVKSHCDIIADFFKPDEPSGLFKIEIPKELKFEFLARLKIMNITPESLFPGLDGLGKSIKEELLIRKWSKK